MKLPLRSVFGFALVLAIAASSAARAETNQEELVSKARLTIERLSANPDFGRMNAAIKTAQAVMIFPSVLKGSFIIGAEGGNGVLLTKDANGEWSYPAFYTLGAGSIGLQAGFQDSEAVFVINTLKGLNAILNNNFKFGVEASVALGPVGQGIEGSTTTAFGADIEAYSATRGLFAGGSFEGAVMYERSDWSRNYYEVGASARGVAMERAFRNPQADGLREAMAKISSAAP
ncbi:MAG: lipid-binding SYLF domain-containing protein [Alphaproteobacteria bacterium]